jgi:hypothetical protein
MVGALVKLLSYPVQETRGSNYSPRQGTSIRRAKASVWHRLVYCEHIRGINLVFRLKSLKIRRALFLRRPWQGLLILYRHSQDLGAEAPYQSQLETQVQRLYLEDLLPLRDLQQFSSKPTTRLNELILSRKGFDGLHT